MKKVQGKSDTSSIVIQEIERRRARFCALGSTPLLMNRFSRKSIWELLLPSPKKNQAERAATIKHDPVQEYRESVYRLREDAPVRLHLPTGSFKQAIAWAALDIPGATKAQIGRLTAVPGNCIHLYGRPMLHMSMVRMADMARTPDVRTRAILPRWACTVEVDYNATILTERVIANLLAAAGAFVGIGEWRPQKGSGSFGCFEVVSEDNPEFLDIVQNEGRAVQDEALANPVCYDEEAEELLAWFNAEIIRREKKLPSAAPYHADLPGEVSAEDVVAYYEAADDEAEVVGMRGSGRKATKLPAVAHAQAKQAHAKRRRGSAQANGG